MSPPTLTPEARATQVYADLIRDLSERGLGDVWQSIDVDTRNVDIRPGQALILAALRATEQETRQQEQLQAVEDWERERPKNNWYQAANVAAWLRARATERGGSQP